MEMNEYYMEFYVRHMLAESRAAAAEAARRPAPPAVVVPAVRRAIDGARRLYARWAAVAAA
jgi:hypothetical protein